MSNQHFAAVRRQQIEEDQPSALNYWATGLSCLGFLVFVFWLAGWKF
jgi:hypothetical protein